MTYKDNVTSECLCSRPQPICIPSVAPTSGKLHVSDASGLMSQIFQSRTTKTCSTHQLNTCVSISDATGIKFGDQYSAIYDAFRVSPWSLFSWMSLVYLGLGMNKIIAASASAVELIQLKRQPSGFCDCLSLDSQFLDIYNRQQPMAVIKIRFIRVEVEVENKVRAMVLVQ